MMIRRRKKIWRARRINKDGSCNCYYIILPRVNDDIITLKYVILFAF